MEDTGIGNLNIQMLWTTKWNDFPAGTWMPLESCNLIISLQPKNLDNVFLRGEDMKTNFLFLSEANQMP